MTYVNHKNLPGNSPHLEEIIRQTENKSRELQRAHEEVESVKNNRNIISSESISMENKLAKLQVKLDNILIKIKQKEEEYKATVKHHDTIEKEKTREFDLLDKAIKKHEEIYSRIKDQQIQFKEVIAVLGGAKKELIDTQNKKDEMEKEIHARFRDVTIKEKELSDKEKDVDDKILKNGIMVARIEGESGKLEMYVKRLQRYYDEHNVNIYILDEFGIKADNN